ncbi:pyridoxal phosphate biosynthetic protein PdxJ, partial [Burkholderia gladioli]|uniref:ParB/RepB/Spo0J family partition protein n=1 Tax=Burkholderia gladioli TaxID=28095 RepID=UPI00163E1643|nr:pyridoxal phosphate biosynthetic protein PdxJ [Burkholderia gladioli]
MDERTRHLDLIAPIPTGNTKAAAAAAGATSADLWMVPYGQLHYDPADNIRPVDPEWVTHLTALIVENGYDKGSPLHCYARKVDGKDLLYVYKGQHRYLAAGKAIEAGKDVGKIPVVVRDAKTVNRAEMVIDGYLSNDSKRSSPLELASVVAELRDIHGMTLAAICKRLNVTDQTVRDVGLLERAPVELHQMVRDGAVAGTLAIEQIREHGADKALDRLQKGAAKAAESGKVRVTKKHLDASPDARQTVAAPPNHLPAKSSRPEQASARSSAPAKISEQQAKQLLQALQAVLHDGGFGKLSQATIAAVHGAMMPLAAMLDTPARKKSWPVTEPNENGICDAVETLEGPARTDRVKGPLAYIRVAQPAHGIWISSIEYNTGSSFASSPLKLTSASDAAWTRVQAIHAGAALLIKSIKAPGPGVTRAEQTAFARILAWANTVADMPDPDWTSEFTLATAKGQRPDISGLITTMEDKRRLAAGRALLNAALPVGEIKPGLEPNAAWPYPKGAAN